MMSANPPVAQPVRDTKSQWFKEIVIAILSIASFAALIFFFLALTALPSEPQLKLGDEEQKVVNAHDQARTENTRKVIDMLLPIVSALLGYYVGRIPAEKAAATSQQIAQQKTDEAAAEKARADRTASQIAPSQQMAEQKTEEAAAANAKAQHAVSQLAAIVPSHKQAISLLTKERSLREARSLSPDAAADALQQEIDRFLDEQSQRGPLA